MLVSAVALDLDGEPYVLSMARDVTERKQAIEALARSEERFRMLAASVPVGIFQTNAEGKIEYANQRVLKITGLTALEETADWRWGIDPHLHDREAVLAERTKAMAEGRVFLGDFRILTPQGVTRWVETRICPLFNEKGEQIGHAGLVEDVTERRQAEEALRESEERFRQVLEASTDVICRVDLASGACEYVSPAVLPLTGFTQDEYASLGLRNFCHRMHPEDWPQYRRRLDDFLRLGSISKTADRHECRWRCKEGQYRWFTDNLALVRGGDGQPLALVITSRDTTKRREAEQALRQSEEHFRELSVSSPVGVFRADAEGRTLYTNERLREVTGLTVEQNMGLGWTTVVHPDDRDRVLAERSKAIAAGQQYTLECRLQTRHKGISWVRLHSRPVLSADGVPVARVGTIEDVTEHREAVERERRLHQQEARTRELRTTVRVLEQMAATLAHELRNPLGVISNSAYFLSNQSGIDDPTARKHAEIISREVQSAKRVIDDILEFARIPQIVLAPASLNVIVEQTLARSQIPANIRVTHKLTSGLPPLVCDRERLERAFLDVIANAVKAMPSGGRLSVRTRLSQDGAVVVFSDTGEGIARQDLAKVFEPMFTTKLRGVGLGLTVVRRTVEEHGGRVDIKSTQHRGTSVTITLPLTRVDSAKDVALTPS